MIPTAQDVYDYLNGFCIEGSVVPAKWVESRIKRYVVPLVEKAVGYSIRGTESVTEYYSGTGGSLLILDKRPVIEVTNITYTNIPTENQTGNLLLSVELIGPKGILKAKTNFNEGHNDPIFPKGNKNIKVTYTVGVDLPDDEEAAAADLKEVVVILAAKQVLINIGNRTGGGDMSTQGWSRSYGSRGKYTHIMNQMDKDAGAILRNYVTGVVGA